MRDEEHSLEFKKLMPELDTYFRAGMRGYVARADKAAVSDDLIQLTGILSLQYCRKPKYNSWRMDKLIRRVGRSVLYRFQHPPKKQKDIKEIGAKELNAGSDADPLSIIIAREDLARLRAFAQDDVTLSAIARRDEGARDCEIARELGITEEALRKRISRLVAKIKSRWPNRGAM